MPGKCKLNECPAPVSCHMGQEDYKTCKHWLANNSIEESKDKDTTIEKKSNLTWTGEPFITDDLRLVTSRTTSIFIGIVGKAAASKTTFLAMFYTLLLGGRKLKNYNFAGTKTILGWDVLFHRLNFQKGKVDFPEPTPVNSNRILHIALRNNEGQLKDLLFSDASGEVFTLWSQNREDENAEIARWIYANANAFMFFIDCEALIDRKNSAKTEIIDIAQQLKHDLKERPIIAVWSKSDRINEVNPNIKESLKGELQETFNNYREIEISNFSKKDPDKLCHDNNLEAIDWLLDKIMVSSGQELFLLGSNTNDLFLNYKGK